MAARSTRVRELVAAAVDHGALPPRPGPELDGYLDATERCVRRYGWSRTSAQDIAREAGVNRTTIYRVLGAKDEIFRLLADRQAHRLIEQAVQRGAAVRDRGAPAAEAIIELAAAAIEQVRHHPTIAKVLADEPELVASFMRTGIPEVLDRFTRVLGPRLGAAMARGVVARRDPDLVTEWIVRLCLSLLFAPPRGDLRAFLAAGIRPLLEVESAS